MIASADLIPAGDFVQLRTSVDRVCTPGETMAKGAQPLPGKAGAG